MRALNAWLPRGRPGSWVVVAVSVIVMASMFFARRAIDLDEFDDESIPMLTAMFYHASPWFWPTVVACMSAFALGKDAVWKHPDTRYLLNLMLLAGFVLLLILNVFAFVMPVYTSVEGMTP